MERIVYATGHAMGLGTLTFRKLIKFFQPVHWAHESSSFA